MGSPELPQEEQNNFSEAISNNAAIDMTIDDSETSENESETEFGGNEYAGYQPLAADDYGNNEMDDETEVISLPPPLPPSLDRQDLPSISSRVTEAEVSVWNAPRPESSDIKLDTAQVSLNMNVNL